MEERAKTLASRKKGQKPSDKTNNLRLLCEACQNGNLDDVKSLMPKVPHSMVNETTAPFTSPPLVLAIYGGHIEVVSFLLEHPWVEIDAQDDDKISGRIAAVGSPNSVEMVTFLLDHARFRSLHIDEPDSSGVSLLGQACVRGNLEVAKLLMKRGANPKQRQVYLGDEGELGETCLHLAAQSGDLEVLKAVLDSGVPLDITDCNQRTAIFSAIKYGMINIVKWLVEMGVDLNWVDLVGLTPRDYADSIGMHQSAIYLARNGAQSQRSVLRKPRGFVAQWSRLWPYGDMYTSRTQPQLAHIGNYVYISGGCSKEENFDPSECFRLHIDTIRPTALKTILDPKLRPYSLSSSKKGEFLTVFEHFSESNISHASSEPTPSSNEVSSSSTTENSDMIISRRVNGTKRWRVTCNTPDTCAARYSSVMFETPYQVRKGTVAYYEVKIITISDAGVVAIGMAPDDFSYQNTLPGWTAKSYAYHSDDGTSFTQTDPVYWGPAVYEGDTFGVGVHWDSGCVFFTHNGAFLGPIHNKHIGSNPLYGCIGLIGKGTTAEINFGVDEEMIIPKLSDSISSSIPSSSSVPSASEMTSISQKHPWLFNFEVMAIKCERCVPNVAPIQGSALERRMILLHEFTRLGVNLGPYILHIEALEAFAYLYDTRSADLYKLTYESVCPLESGELLQIAFSGDKLYCIDFQPNHSFESDHPGFELSEAIIEAVFISVLDLKTRRWSVAKVTLSHFKERPLLDIATSHIPYEDHKLWFLHSPNCPFYIDVRTWRAFRFSSQTEASVRLSTDSTSISARALPMASDQAYGLNLWLAGAAFARIPSEEQLSEEISRSSSACHSSTSTTNTTPIAPNLEISYDFSKDFSRTIQATLESVQPHLVLWNGHSDLRSLHQPRSSSLVAVETLPAWTPSIGGLNVEFEYELALEREQQAQSTAENETTEHAASQTLHNDSHMSTPENGMNTQLIVFGGMPKVTREAAERISKQAVSLNRDVPSLSELYSSGQSLLSSDLYFFHPQTRTWTIPRVQGFLPTPKGQNDMVYIGNGHLISFGGSKYASNAPMEIELLSLNASFSTDDKLGIFFNNPLCSDFEIRFPAIDGNASETIKAHKAILIARSRFFQKVLSSPLPSTLAFSHAHTSSSDSSMLLESHSSGDMLHYFEVPVQEARHFRRILQYLYSDTVPSDLYVDEYCGFLDLVELHFTEHLARLSELLLLNRLTADSRSTMASLGSLLSDPHGLALADVQLNAEGGNPIICHKVVLCARSEYFKALFGGSMLEGQKGVATINDIPYKVCVEIVRYLYTLTLNLDALEDIIVDVLIWANALSISDLYTSIEAIVVSNLSLENVDYLLEIANTHHLPKLASECNIFKNSPTELLLRQQDDVDLEFSKPKTKRRCTSELMEEMRIDFEAATQGSFSPDENDTEGIAKAKEVMRLFANFAMGAADMAEQLRPLMALNEADPEAFRNMMDHLRNDFDADSGDEENGFHLMPPENEEDEPDVPDRPETSKKRKHP